jgi:hypothetical protein
MFFSIARKDKDIPFLIFNSYLTTVSGRVRYYFSFDFPLCGELMPPTTSNHILMWEEMGFWS